MKVREEVERPAGADPAASPMIQQYRRFKEDHPGALLFFRMGDFYELFFEDAVIAAPALDIALTKRGRHQGDDIPMCGVPAHNAEPYLHRLIRKGFKVAICEQVEDPAEARKRPGKPLVRRDVVRIVTPGTLTEDGLLDASRHNFLAALARVQNGYALAWADISTGELATEASDWVGLPALVGRIEPGELILPQRLFDDPLLRAHLADWDERLTPARDAAFESLAAEGRLSAAFGEPEAFGAFGRAEIAAAGALLDYLELTQKGVVPRLSPPRRIETGDILRLDPATRRNLELVRSLAGERAGSLLGAIDRTRTSAGARLLAERVAAPLVDVAAIRDRLDQVEALSEDGTLCEELRERLKRCPDLGRALSRLVLGRGGPRDLAALAAGLDEAAAIAGILDGGVPVLRELGRGIPDSRALAAQLDGALVEEPPLLARDGGFVARGMARELDELRSLRDEARRHIAALEARYRESCGIASLKIRHNNLIGYYVEVPAAQRAKIGPEFHQRQSMANATRFSSAELVELEQRLASAGDRALALELEIFEALRQAVIEAGEAIAASARCLAEIDVATALAHLATARRWVRPQVDDGTRLRIEGGRHPVVEAALQRERKTFVPNDLELDEADRLWLLTGPNMAGKSTFLRQCALIVVLAQIGSFVPAASAEIGIVDRLFSRVGAADDLARGRSTFMVEMVETATILNQAGPRSFVILDEIGRGTATYDGLSIAWAVVEHLHEVNRSRGLFATHYHELTALASKLPGLHTHTMRVKEWQGEVVFLHEVTRGAADRSYGIHVAKLAGLPKAVVRRADEVLKRLEATEAASAPAALAEDLPLFAAARPRAGASGADAEASAAEQLLDRTDPDGLAPREALELLYELKRLRTAAEPP